MPHAPLNPPPPTSLPRSAEGFHLRRELGRGGMGVVYEAQEIATGRTVALKVLLAELALSDEAMERFQREARLAAAISHAHCVFVYGAHSVEGAPAIAMELIGGETLEDKIRRGEPIPVETAVRWAIDILDGLEAAHRAGVLHRDVKPSNCFVTTDGRVKVGDFGLSRSLERDIQLTQSGQFLGSPLYASPEQIRGRAYDVRSDLYSCGATLYAILTGRPPFSGKNVGEVLARILSEEPPHPRSIRPGIPRALEAVVMRAMARDPEKRWRDLNEFRAALEPFTRASGTVAPPWRRVGAYLIDVALTQLLVPLLFLLEGKLEVGLFEMKGDGNWRPTAIGQAVLSLVTIVYFTLSEGWRGYGLGKWLLGLRVVSTDTREPSVIAAGLRALVLLGPGAAFGLALSTLAPQESPLVEVIGPLVIVLLLFSTARRSNGWRGVHELASRTIVLPVSPPFLRARYKAPPPEMTPEPSAELPDRMGEYAVEGVVGRTSKGRMLKARDALLERSVWIHLPESGAALAGDVRRSLARPGRLRWLGVVPTPAGAGDVFESPGGTSLPAFSQRHGRLDWHNAQRLLLALVEELTAQGLEPGGTAHVGTALEQVWIDRNWDLRLLDEPVGHPPFTPHAPVVLVREAARALFLGHEAGDLVLPPDLPVHAEPIVRQLMSEEVPFQDLAAVRDALVRISSGPAAVLRRTRGAQMSINVILPAAVLLFAVGFGLVIASLIAKLPGLPIMIGELDKGRMEMSVDPLHAGEPPPILRSDQRRAREILIANAFSDRAAPFLQGPWTPQERALIDAAMSMHANPSETDVEWAEGMLRAEAGRSGEERRKPAHSEALLIPVTIGVGGILLWGVVSVLLAFFLRGGLTFLLLGIRVRDRRGRTASRILCCARCFLAWLPLVGGTVAAMFIVFLGHALVGAIVVGVFVLAYAAALTDAIVHPAQCLVDRLLKTRLVPR